MATMKDVARLAGVSTSTVSHVINNDRFVSDTIREKVLKVVKQLNYSPSAVARSLKVNRTKTIGMLVTASNNPFFSEIVRGVEQSCYERNYSLILCNTEGNRERMEKSLHTLLQKRVDGLLVMCTEQDPLQTEVLNSYPSLPVVMMDWAPYPFRGDIIKDNSRFGGELATSYLISQGYSKIACIAGPQNKSPAQGRLAGYRQAMLNANLPLLDEYQVIGNFEFQGGVKAMQQLLALTSPPHAVFACNDAMAVGVYQALHLAGLSAGKDVAVIGYDDIELAKYLSPALTTVHQPKDELGQLAVDTLLCRLQEPEKEIDTLTLKPKLIERSSTPRLILT